MSPIVLSAASSVAVASARASSNFQRARVAAASSSKVTKKSLASSSSSSLAARAVVVVVARGESSSRARRARGSPIVRAAAEDTEESTAAPATPPSAPKPASTKPGQGKPPIAPSYLALGDATASILIVLIARGAAGQDVLSPGTIIAIPPFVLGWVGAGFFAGDYDADSPNAALWGDVPRAMSTGALTWFSGSAIAILVRNAIATQMTVPPAIDESVVFAGGLGLICAFRALVAVTKPGAGDGA